MHTKTTVAYSTFTYHQNIFWKAKDLINKDYSLTINYNPHFGGLQLIGKTIDNYNVL